MKTKWSSIEEWAAALENVTPEGRGYRSACPVENADETSGGRHFTFDLDERTNRIVFHDFGGHSYQQITQALHQLGLVLWNDNREFKWPDEQDTKFLHVRVPPRDGRKKFFFWKCVSANGVPTVHNSKNRGTRGPDNKCKMCGVGTKDFPRMLWHPKELTAAIERGVPIILTEGESDSVAVMEHKGSRDIFATTASSGAMEWGTVERDQLTGAAEIWILADVDSDATGFRGAWKKYLSLCEFGNVVVKRPASGKDAFEHFANGHGLDDFVTIERDELAELANPDTPTSSLTSGDVFGYTHPEYADRFVAEYGAVFRYITAEKQWLHFNEGRWREDTYDAEFHFCETLCRKILAETPEFVEDGSKVKPNPKYKVAEMRTNSAQVEAIVRMARTRRPIVTTRNKFDQNPMLINVVNGTYDLAARELREHRQEDMITKMCPFKYDPKARGSHFDDYFETVQPDPHWREQIFMFLGYSITGHYGDYAFVHVGSGGNGKTTLLKLATRVLGDYATGASWKILSNQADDSHETILAKLEGRRFAVVQMGGRSLSSEQLRTIVAEPDFEARKMHQDSRTLESTHTIHVAQNDPPPLKQLDASTRRRLIVIDWITRIEDPDDSLPGKLASEGDYVLTKIIDAHAKWKPQQVDRKATEAYFGRNLSYAWLETSGEVERDPDSWLYAKEHLYAAFVRWCEENGKEPDNENVFGRTLTGLGSEREKRDLGDGRKTARSGYRFTEKSN